MSKIKDQIYTISAIDTIINGKQETDLGNYTLEFATDLDNCWFGSNEESFASLVIMVRLRNNETKKLEYGNVFYKVISKLHKANDLETEKLYSQLMNGTLEEKMAFIMRPETLILRKPYAKSGFVGSYDFLNDFTYVDGYDYPSVALGGKVPNIAETEITEYYRNVLESTNEQLHSQAPKK